MDASAGVTQEEGNIGFLHLPSGVFALIFLARRIQSSLSQVTVESNFVYPRINRSPGMFFVFCFFCLLFVRENHSSYDCTEIQTHVSTSEGLRLLTEPTTGAIG